MTRRKTAERHPRRDGNLLRTEKVQLLKEQIQTGNYEVEEKFKKIVNSFIDEFVR